MNLNKVMILSAPLVLYLLLNATKTEEKQPIPIGVKKKVRIPKLDEQQVEEVEEQEPEPVVEELPPLIPPGENEE